MATTISDPAAFAESHFGISLKRKTDKEWCSPCPKCGGADRFLVFADGGFWCRQCNYQGWLDNLDGSNSPTKEQLLEARIRRLEQKQREHERRLSALERMARCQDHIAYNRHLNDSARDWWLEQGINGDSIGRYLLGYCPRCPTDSEGRASYTIPVINHGQLQNIRHRLANSPNGDKYRPHMAGLGNQLFNADFLKDATDIVIVEGAKKSIVLDQNGFPNVAIMGKRAFKRDWLGWFGNISTVHVALDPDARESANRLASIFDGKGRVVHLPVKPDDFFTLYGGSISDFADFLRLAKPARRAA